MQVLGTTVGEAASAALVSPPLEWQASVPTAFALGWQMSELYALAGDTALARDAARAEPPVPLRAPPSVELDEMPPMAGMADWPVADRWDLTVRQAEAKARRLKSAFLHIGSDVEGLDRFEASVGALVGEWRTPGLAAEVADAYHGLVMTLAAAHARLGRACELGCGLAVTCRVDTTPTAAELADLFGERLTPLQATLTDLASSLPEHASRAVSLSLAQWQKWARSGTAEAAVPSDLPALLRRQGELWRAVLGGEKLGQDMLAGDDYLGASKTLVRTLFDRPRLWAAMAGVAALVGVAIYLILTAPDAIKAVSGAGLSILSAAGLTIATLKRSAAQVGDRLMNDVWSAELDWAIAQAVTLEPPGWMITLRRREVSPRGPDRAPPRQSLP